MIEKLVTAAILFGMMFLALVLPPQVGAIVGAIMAGLVALVFLAFAFVPAEGRTAREVRLFVAERFLAAAWHLIPNKNRVELDAFSNLFGSMMLRDETKA